MPVREIFLSSFIFLKSQVQLNGVLFCAKQYKNETTEMKQEEICHEFSFV